MIAPVAKHANFDTLIKISCKQLDMDHLLFTKNNFPIKKLIILLLLLPLRLFSQDTTGIWTGFINTTEKRLPYEIAISKNDGKLTGYSHITFTVNGVEFVAVKSIKFKNEDGNIIMEDDELVYDNLPNGAPKNVTQISTLSLKKEDSIMVLSGSFETKKTRRFRTAEGNISLQKKNKSTPTKLMAKLDEMKLSGTLSFLQPEIKHEEVAVEPTIEIPKPTEQKMDIAAAVPKPQEFKPVLHPKETGLKVVPPPALPKAPLATVQPKPVEVASAPAKPKVISPAPQQKPKETKIITAEAKEKKPVPVAQQKPKEKQIVVAAKPLPENKPTPVPPKPQPKPEVVIVTPPAEIPKPVTIPGGAASDIAKRNIETIQTVMVKTDSVVLSLYDNGYVDGDTVSIILNGRVILGKQGLSTRAITKTIYMTPDLGDSMQLIMYAENLGSIPPNTGLLILQDGNDRYEIRFTGDLQKNAAIILKRRNL